MGAENFKKSNENIRQWLFAMVELSMEHPINLIRMQQIWKGIEKNEFREIFLNEFEKIC